MKFRKSESHTFIELEKAFEMFWKSQNHCLFVLEMSKRSYDNPRHNIYQSYFLTNGS